MCLGIANYLRNRHFFPHGVYLVSAAGTTGNPAALRDAVAEAVGLRTQARALLHFDLLTGTPASRTNLKFLSGGSQVNNLQDLFRRLQDRDMLLVLDDCETPQSMRDNLAPPIATSSGKASRRGSKHSQQQQQQELDGLHRGGQAAVELQWLVKGLMKLPKMRLILVSKHPLLSLVNEIMTPAPVSAAATVPAGLNAPAASSPITAINAPVPVLAAASANISAAAGAVGRDLSVPSLSTSIVVQSVPSLHVKTASELASGPTESTTPPFVTRLVHGVPVRQKIQLDKARSLCMCLGPLHPVNAARLFLHECGRRITYHEVAPGETPSPAAARSGGLQQERALHTITERAVTAYDDAQSDSVLDPSAPDEEEPEHTADPTELDATADAESHDTASTRSTGTGTDSIGMFRLPPPPKLASADDVKMSRRSSVGTTTATAVAVHSKLAAEEAAAAADHESADERTNGDSVDDAISDLGDHRESDSYEDENTLLEDLAKYVICVLLLVL